MTEFGALELTETDVEALQAAAAGVDHEAIVVRPDEDNSGIEGAVDVLRGLPRADTESAGLLGGERNVSSPFAYEMRYASPEDGGERVLSLQYVGMGDRVDALLGRHLPDEYPESLIERQPATWFTPEEGQHMAAATLGLRRYTLYPLWNAALDDDDRRDPTGSILREMVGVGDAAGVDADVAVQVLARPAGTDWKEGVPGGYGLADTYGDGLAAEEAKVRDPLSTQKLRHFLKQPTEERQAILPTPIGSFLGWIHPFFRDEFEHPPSEADKKAARMLGDLDGRGWAFQVRAVAVSDDPDLARERVALTTEMFDKYYESRGGQTFLPIPRQGEDVLEVATQAAGRAWDDDPEQRMTKPQIELAGLVNIPRADAVGTNKLRWALSSPGDGVPVGTPRAEWDALGVDPATASKEEQQVALLEADDGVTWYGLGSRHGVEAGIDYSVVTNPHKFVHGESGTGKTTFLAGDASQQFRRPGGGLRLDPTGDDTDDVLAEWPADRDPEELIYMDLSGEYERIPRFNFLEVPSYLEEGTRQHTEFLEALAEDILAMVGEAGGSDNYVGGLMKRVLKTVVRAMGRRGETATLFDVAAVCSSSENLAAFAEEMPDDRLAYLRDRVRSLAEREDSELDPLAGRLDEWVLNENVRELICARDPTFSVHEAVAEGREIVVRFSDSGSDTVRHMVGNALITRTYFSQRYHRPEEPFELVVDEAQSVITAASDIENIMDQGRKFGYRATIACQRPATQLSDTVRAAVLGNARTTISFSSGREEEAKAVAGQHDGVDAEDLTNFSPFKFYMSTITADREATHAYKVDAFRSPRAARVMAAEAAGEDADARDAEIAERVEALKEASLGRYGITREAVEETRSLFDVREDGLRVTDAVERAAALGVWSAACRAGDPAGAVTLADCADAVRRRVSALEATPDDTADRLVSDGDVYRRVLQHVDEDVLADEGDRLRVVSPRSLLGIGTDQSAGSIEHHALLRDGARTLTTAGAWVDVLQASGADPDAVVRASPDADPVVDAIVGDGEARLEASHTTGTSKPASDVKHSLEAAEDGQRCIHLVRPPNAANVAQALLGEPQFARETVEADGETLTRLYNSPRDVLDEDGEPATRPGARENVWLQDEDGQLILRDGDGTEHGRGETPEAVVSAVDPGGESPEDGEARRVKRPIPVPETAEPRVTVITVPEGADSLAEFGEVVDADGSTVPLTDRYPTSLVESVERGVTPSLDVPDRAERLLDLLQEHGSAVTTTEAGELAAEHDDDLDRSYQTVRNWITALVEAGALEEVGTDANDATLYEPIQTTDPDAGGRLKPRTPKE